MEGGKVGQVMRSTVRISPKSGLLPTSHPAAKEIDEARNGMKLGHGLLGWLMAEAPLEPRSSQGTWCFSLYWVLTTLLKRNFIN